MGRGENDSSEVISGGLIIIARPPEIKHDTRYEIRPSRACPFSFLHKITMFVLIGQDIIQNTKSFSKTRDFVNIAKTVRRVLF